MVTLWNFIWFLTLSKEPNHEKKWNIYVDIISIFALSAHLRSQGILLICVLPSFHISGNHSFHFTVIEMIISLLTIILHSLTLDFKSKSRCLSGMHSSVSISFVSKTGLFSNFIIIMVQRIVPMTWNNTTIAFVQTFLFPFQKVKCL